MSIFFSSSLDPLTRSVTPLKSIETTAYFLAISSSYSLLIYLLFMKLVGYAHFSPLSRILHGLHFLYGQVMKETSFFGYHVYQKEA